MVDAVETTADVFCRTTLNFAARRGAMLGAPVSLDILDGRRADLPGWEECGFERITHRSAVAGWDDDELISTHHGEMEELARRLTGADIALVSSHIKRGPEHVARHADLGPISFAHSDFAVGSDQLVRRSFVEPRAGADGPVRALARNGVTAREVADASRLVILQFWRNLGPAKMDFPLAFCDARTVSPTDVRPIPVSDYAGSGIDFDALALLEPLGSGQYSWYVFPDLEIDEVVAFRTYDTALVERGETWFTPHSAFRDPDVEVGRPARSSIELRAICLFA